MLDTMPYADLLAIYNAIAEKPVTRFDTRANGVRRTEAILDARGLTLAEAAGLADVVLPGGNVSQQEAPTGDNAARVALPGNDADPNQPEAGREGDPMGDKPGPIIQIDASIAPFVNAFVRELMKPERPAHVAAFLRRLQVGGAAPGRTTTKRDGGMTRSQRKIVELCSRPEGATGKELAEGCGWPSIAARATCQKLAERFGYDLHESPKANGRGISFRMTARPAAEEQAS
jgi:hypothetical protein